MWAHGRALLVQMFAVTFITGASSSVPMRTDVVSGAFASIYGIWRGQVHMADDFDELPDDIAEAFGAR